MRKTILLTIVSAVFALCCGCTSLGPFVTNVSRDENGNLVVEKSIMELNTFTGNMSFTNKTQSTIPLKDEQKQISDKSKEEVKK